ncbi:hypothetical protein [Actinomyces trachealis]|uniref:AMIN-like domain-containing (lipo)protein n=1 Tax=Actinomyces trachealis TaxID=2763540 RepID=UPI001892BEC8|nr:hypothetical protein [Actinomyces trachealis]
MTSITRRHVLALGPLTWLGLLTACGSQPSSSAASGAPSGSQASPTAAGSAKDSATASHAAQGLTMQEEATASTLGWLSEASSQAHGGEPDLVITAVRTGQHKDFDRVVVEFSGTGTPGWDAAWVNQAYTQGKGDPISVTGENQLLLRGTGVTMPVMPEQQEVAYEGPYELGVNGAAIGSAYIDLTFEAQFQLVVGTHSQDYRVFTLTAPTRLVVDVAPAQARG